MKSAINCLVALMLVACSGCLTHFSHTSLDWKIVSKNHEQLFILPPLINTELTENQKDVIQNEVEWCKQESQLVRALFDQVLKSRQEKSRNKLGVKIVDRWETENLSTKHHLVVNTGPQPTDYSYLSKIIPVQAVLEIVVSKNCLFNQQKPAESRFNLAFAEWIQGLKTDKELVKPWPGTKVYKLGTDLKLIDLASGKVVWLAAIKGQADWETPPAKLLEQQLSALVKEFPYWP